MSSTSVRYKHEETMTKKNDVLPEEGAQAAAVEPRRVEVQAGAYFSLTVIGVGSIIFGCADLVAGFMAFSFLWSWAWLFTYAWAGFLFAMVSGSLCLKAASTKPVLDRQWTNVAFGFGCVTLLFHLLDFAIAITSVATLAASGETLIRNETTYEYSGKPESHLYYRYYYYQSALVAEAPRLVIVSVLLALDIWLLVVTSTLRALPKGDKSSEAQNSDETLRLGAIARQALLASAAFSIVYGAGQLVAGLCAVSEWTAELDHVKWLSFGFTCVACLFSIVNAALAVRAALNKPSVDKLWSGVVFSVGILSLIVYVAAMGPALYAIIITGPIGPNLYRVVEGGVVSGENDVFYNSYETQITPAVPEAARLVTLAVLFAMTLVQVCIASKLRRHFKVGNQQMQAMYSRQLNVQSEPDSKRSSQVGTSKSFVPSGSPPPSEVKPK